jgi:hypothetical protein
VVGDSYSTDGDLPPDNGACDFWIVKLNSFGNLQWQKSFGGSGEEFAYSVDEMVDGCFIITGKTQSNDLDITGYHGGGDIWVIKLSETGDLLWKKCLGGSSIEEAITVKSDSGGGFYIVGYTSSNDGDMIGNSMVSAAFLMKLDIQGAILWKRFYGGMGTNYFSSFECTADGGFIVAGWSTAQDGDVNQNNGMADYWALKLANTGDIEWSKSFGGSSDDWSRFIRQTPDGGYVLVGTTFSNNGDVSMNQGFYDVWLLKLDQLGNVLWEKTFGGSYMEDALSIDLSNDGGYIFSGLTSSTDGDIVGNHSIIGGYDFWQVKIDNQGQLLWQKCFGGSYDEWLFSAQKTADGGSILAGRGYSNDGDVSGNHGTGDYWLVKLSPEAGVEENSEITSIQLFPNPTRDALTIEVDASTLGASYCILDEVGRVVHSGKIDTIESTLSTAHLAAGFYTFILDGKEEKSLKWVKL